MDDFFVGEYEHRVDAKGRLFLPRKLVEGVQDPADRERFVVVLGLDRCLLLFTRRGFAAHVRHLRHSAHGPEEYRRMMRGMGALASDQAPDNHGRILLNEELRSRADIARDVVLVGAVDHVEIWDAKAWHSREKPASEHTYRERSSGYFPGRAPQPQDGAGQ